MPTAASPVPTHEAVAVALEQQAAAAVATRDVAGRPGEDDAAVGERAPRLASTRQRVTRTSGPSAVVAPWQAHRVRDPASTARESRPVSPETHTSPRQVGERTSPAIAYDAHAGTVSLGDDQPTTGGLLDVPGVLEATNNGAHAQGRLLRARRRHGRGARRRGGDRGGEGEQAAGEGGEQRGGGARARLPSAATLRRGTDDRPVSFPAGDHGSSGHASLNRRPRVTRPRAHPVHHLACPVTSPAPSTTAPPSPRGRGSTT